MSVHDAAIERLREVQESIRSSGLITVIMSREGDSLHFVAIVDGVGMISNPGDVGFAAGLVSLEAMKANTAAAAAAAC